MGLNILVLCYVYKVLSPQNIMVNITFKSWEKVLPIRGKCSHLIASKRNPFGNVPFQIYQSLVTIHTFLIIVRRKNQQNVGGTSLIHEVMEYLSSLYSSQKHLEGATFSSYLRGPTVLLDARSWYLMTELIRPLSSEHDVRFKRFQALYLSKEFLNR